MEYSTGKLLFILVLAVALSCAGAWLLVHRYRKVMQRLMRSPVKTASGARAPASESPSAPVCVTLADNRRSGLRLSLLLIGLSCLMAISSASIWMWLSFPGEPLPPKRVAVVALLHLWPVIPALALLWRWSRARLFGVLLLWCVLCFFIMLWRSIEPRPLEVVITMAGEIGPAMVLIALILLSGTTRAVAPWLLLPVAGLVWASMFGMDVLALMVEQRSPALLSLTQWMDANTVMLAFVLAPWGLAWWPLKKLGQALGKAYTHKLLSELMIVFTTVWAFTLMDRALTVASSAGVSAIAMFVPLLWIPIVISINRPALSRGNRAPMLLVLRVFQRDAQVQALFDDVIERWRLSGNTAMIAGTDLADRTIDAEDIFMFLDGRLEERFINTVAEVAPRIAQFDLLPDADGRYRVNECYCHDTTWQDALIALVERSDVVLMDLRGFKAHNDGCRFELATLGRTARELRVVVLTDKDTDREVADTEIGPGGRARFVWLDTPRIDTLKSGEVLASLFAAR